MWYVKYYSDWKDFKGNDNRIEILTKGVVVAKEVKISSFTINHPTIDLFSNIAVYGSGANITLISENRLDYYNELYSINPQTFLFKHYLNNSLNFVGYLDTEQYQDYFANGVNYEFSITANDGISVLDRIKISDNNGNELDGIYNALDVIKYALNKLNIDYNYLYLGINTTIENIASNETLLHKLNIRSANYVDEKGNWMSCREVINAILLPLTLKLHIIGNDVYIVDINKLASENNLTLKQYNFSNLSYVKNVTITNLFEINKSLNNSVLNKQSGVSKVDLKFNKYIYDDIRIDINEKTVSDFISETEITNNLDKTYNVKRFKGCENYTNLDNNADSAYFEQITDVVNPDNVDYTVRIKGLSDIDKPVETFTPVYSLEIDSRIDLVSSNYYIKLKGEAMAVDDSKFLAHHELNYVLDFSFYLKVQIGNKYYSKEHGWTNNPNSYLTVNILDYLKTTGETKITVNQWFSLNGATFDTVPNNLSINDLKFNGIIIPLNSDLFKSANTIEGGRLKFQIGTYNKRYYGPASDGVTLPYIDGVMRFKNLSVSIVEKDQWGNYIEVDNNDIEYQGTIDENYVNSLFVETLHGTDAEGTGRGIYLINISGKYDDSKYATNQRIVGLNSVKRAGNEGTTEELLLNTYLSNLQKSRNLLSVTLLDYYSMINTFKYKINSKLENLKFIPISLTCDYVNAESSVQLLEFVKDEVL